MEESKEAMKFRSVLPHEPLPTSETKGYLIIQGSFEPKREKNESESNDSDTPFWTRSELEQTLFESLQQQASCNDNINVESVEALDHSHPFTKMRITINSPQAARDLLVLCKSSKLTPADLLTEYCSSSNSEHQGLHFGTRQLQVTRVTTTPALSSSIEKAWPRSNPPKFRRLLARPGEDLQALEAERAKTRFVFVSGLLGDDATPDLQSCWNKPFVAAEAIRTVVNVYDTSGLGVEVFVPNKKTAARACHVGMRSPADAKMLISKLQGQQVEWPCRCSSNTHTTTFIKSGRLFLDYADITKRSYSRGSNPDPDAKGGEPSRSECTSLTAHVIVPGLVLVPDYISEAEEESLMAVLTGPQAPWAPPQSTPSLSGNVKRRVQHYGYVFDYETADVLRDKTTQTGACPPMPALDDDKVDNVEKYIESSVKDGRGWEALAGVIERTRQHEFSVNGTAVRFPDLNQMTVNEYKEGSGIGSHVDTKTAFGDGLISISLNSGIVMEFRQAREGNDDSTTLNDSSTSQPLRKLVYLPRRSMLLMSGPARYTWEHMIVSRMTDTVDGNVVPRGRRVSLTLRTALELPSDGGVPLARVESNVFPPIWGQNKSEGNVSSENGNNAALVTPSTEKEHVHAVYDAIATQWHHTRGKRGVLWPGATQFLQQLPRGSVVADVGCGDGKYFPAIWEAGSFVIGTDISLPLLKTSVGASSGDESPESRRISEERNHLRDRPAVAVADCMSVPLRSKSCDAAICIAVIHHISTEARRLRCLEELVRVVRPGGLINVQAWAMEQDEGSRRKFAAADVFVPFNAQPKYLDKAQGTNEQVQVGNDGVSVAQMYSEAYDGAEFDERKGLVVFKRYCHLYRQGELDELVSRVKGVELCESGYESGNYFVVLRVVS